jgi:hypothetical protein
MWLFKRKKATIANLYRKCNVLPIHNFNEIATNNDFNYLKVNKNDDVSQIELEETWLIILDEFYKISKNNKALISFKKQINLMLLYKKLTVFEVIKICINKNIDVVAECKKYKIDKTKIDIHIGMLKNDIARISKSIPSEESEGNTNEFERTIAVILKSGFQINRFTTVVSEWVSILNLIQEQNKQTT